MSFEEEPPKVVEPQGRHSTRTFSGPAALSPLEDRCEEEHAGSASGTFDLRFILDNWPIPHLSLTTTAGRKMEEAPSTLDAMKRPTSFMQIEPQGTHPFLLTPTTEEGRRGGTWRPPAAAHTQARVAQEWRAKPPHSATWSAPLAITAGRSRNQIEDERQHSNHPGAGTSEGRHP